MPLFKRIVKILLIIAAGLISLAVLGTLLIGFLIYLDSQKQKSYISAHYKVDMPAILNYQSKAWDGGGIDVQPNWTYAYSANADRKEVYNSVITTLQNNGYKIAQGSCPNDDYLTAFSKKAGVYLTISFNPIANGAPAPPTVSTIKLEAVESHDNVYIDPHALSCANPS